MDGHFSCQLSFTADGLLYYLVLCESLVALLAFSLDIADLSNIHACTSAYQLSLPASFESYANIKIVLVTI